MIYLKRRISGDLVTLRVSAEPGLAKSVLVRLAGARENALDGRTLRLTVRTWRGGLPGLLRALDAAGIALEPIPAGPAHARRRLPDPDRPSLRDHSPAAQPRTEAAATQTANACPAAGTPA